MVKLGIYAEAASFEAVDALVAKLEAAAERMPAMDYRWLASEEIAQAYNGIVQRSKHNWQCGRKRGLHQLQVESLGAAMLEILGQASGGNEQVVAELGAGKAMLGNCVAEVSGSKVVSVERRNGCDDDGDADGENRAVRLQMDVRDASLKTIMSSASTTATGIVVCAKHLCAGGTCSALRLVEEAVRDSVEVRGCVIAPCCHPQLTWGTFCNTQALEALGFDSQNFYLLLSILLLSKEKNMTSSKHSKWTSLKSLGPDKIFRLGRIARRVLEEARRQFLTNMGFNVVVVEYVPCSLTPDNLMLVATRSIQPRAVQKPCPELPFRSIYALPASGVLLHVGGHLTCVSRLIEYLLEMRADGLHSKKQIAIQWVFPIQWEADCRRGVVSAVVVGGPLSELLPLLRGNPILARSCDQLIPFTQHLETLEDLTTILSSGLFTTTPECKIRLAFYPPDLEKSAIAVISGERLSPARFSHTLSVIQWPGEYWCQKGALSCSVMSRELWDPRQWRESVKNDSKGSTALQRSLAQHLNESFERLPSALQLVGRTVIVVADAPLQLEAMVAWCNENSARELVSIQPRKHSDLQWEFALARRITASGYGESDPWQAQELGVVHGEEALSTLVASIGASLVDVRTILWRYERGLEDAVQMLGCLARALSLGPHVTWVGQMKLGRHGRAQNVNKHIASACRGQGFSADVYHLMSDHELDRTLRLSQVPSLPQL